MNYGLLSGYQPHVDVVRQLRSQKPGGGSMASQGWHTQPGRTGSSVSIGITLIGLVPITVFEACTLDILGFEVVTAAASTTGKIGLYDSDPFGMPAFLRANLGSIDSSTTGFKNVQAGMTLEPGLFWAALWTSTASPAYRSYEGGPFDSLHQAAGGQANNTLPASGYITTTAFADLPGFMGSVRLTGASPAPRASWKVTS